MTPRSLSAAPLLFLPSLPTTTSPDQPTICDAGAPLHPPVSQASLPSALPTLPPESLPVNEQEIF